MNRESKLDRFKPYLCQRWNEGITDAAALHAELQQRGWAGRVQTVRRYVAPFRQALAAPEPGPAVLKTRQITRWLLTRPDRLRPEEQEQLGQITERCPHIQALAGYVTSFAEMMTGRTGSQDLEAWLTAIQADDGQPTCAPSPPASATTSRPSPTGSPSPEFGQGRGHRQQDQDDRTADVRPCRRPAPQRASAPSVTWITKFAEEPPRMSSACWRWCMAEVYQRLGYFPKAGDVRRRWSGTCGTPWDWPETWSWSRRKSGRPSVPGARPGQDEGHLRYGGAADR